MNAKGLVSFAVAVAVALAWHAAPAQERTLRIATLQGAAQPSYQGLVKMSELVAQRTNGALKIMVFGDGQLGTEQESIEGVQLGTIDMFMGSTGSIGRFLPRLEAFSHPFLWRDEASMLKVVRGPIGEELSEELRKKTGIRILDMGWIFGWRHLTTKQTAVMKPADMARLKIRVQPTGIFLDTIRAMGGNPTPMDFKEVYTSLQTGVIDGQENPINVIATRAFYEVQGYLVLTGHILQNQAVIMSDKTFQSLKPDQQKVLVQSARDAGDYQNGLLAKTEKEQLDQVRGKGMKVLQPDVAAFRAATADVYKKFENVWGKGFYERVRDAQ